MPGCRSIGARPSHLQLFPMPNVADPADLLLSQDVIFVGGGSVANMLAVWRVHGLDQIMRQAWEAGIVLAGVSAGAICWFAGGTTDSFGPSCARSPTAWASCRAASARTTAPSRPGGPPTRRWWPTARSPAGIACDDGAAAHFADDELAGIVADRPGATGYRVRPDGSGGVTEEPLPVDRGSQP